MNAVVRPRFVHDCEKCVFLGHFGDCDLYACTPGGVRDTVIARRSDEGSDYSSGLAFAYGLVPELTEARVRAEKAGLLGSRWRWSNRYNAFDAEVVKASQDEVTRLRDVLRTIARGGCTAGFTGDATCIHDDDGLLRTTSVGLRCSSCLARGAVGRP